MDSRHDTEPKKAGTKADRMSLYQKQAKLIYGVGFAVAFGEG